MKKAKVTLIIAALTATAPAAAQEVARGNRPMLEAALALKNGEFIWAPEESAAGPVCITRCLICTQAPYGPRPRGSTRLDGLDIARRSLGVDDVG